MQKLCEYVNVFCFDKHHSELKNLNFLTCKYYLTFFFHTSLRRVAQCFVYWGISYLYCQRVKLHFHSACLPFYFIFFQIGLNIKITCENRTEFLCWTFVLVWTGLKSDSCNNPQTPAWKPLLVDVLGWGAYLVAFYCVISTECGSWLDEWKKWNACLRAARVTSHAAVENSTALGKWLCVPGSATTRRKDNI